MDSISIFTFTFTAISIALIFLINNFSSSKKARNLPPSPRSLPIIGHLHLFKKPLHRTLARLSEIHGPILFLRFGSRPVLIISSSALAESCFTTNDIVFANRPRLPSVQVLSANYSSLTFVSYGPHWRNLRRIAATEVLSPARLAFLTTTRATVVRDLAAGLFRYTTGSGFKKVDVRSRMFDLVLGVMMGMIAGKGYRANGEAARNFKAVVEEGFRLAGTNIGDYLPLLRWVDLQGVKKRTAEVQKKREAFLQRLIDEHRSNVDGAKEKTIIRVLLDLQSEDPEYNTDQIIKTLISTLLFAGTETSAVTTEWAMSLLLNNPEVLKKARDEIDGCVEQGKLFEESDLANLPYLNSIIKETLRLYPVAPLLLPHEAAEDCVVGGFDVPRGTMLLANAWAIQRDVKVWENATEFKPDRFLDVGEEGCKMMIPFGMGRRRCPGEALALRMVALALGTMIQCFEWEKIGGEELDMTEGAGLSMPRAKPLEALCRPRQDKMHLLSQL